MRPRYLLAICSLLIFAAACAPASSELTEQQSTDSVAVADRTYNEEDDHPDEDTDENASEESEHADQDMEKNGHGDDGQHREHGAHEHGVATLTIAWSGSEMAIDLQTPSYNVLGFEYTPATDEEKALLVERLAVLEAGDLLQPNPDAECMLVSADIQTDLAEEDHDEDGHDEDQAHSDIDVSYDLVCQQLDNMTSVDASALFAQFPNFEDINVQWISDTQQSAADLTPDSPVLLFK